MDQDFVHMVAASKVPMLKPGEFELGKMRIEQYIQMIDYALRLEVKARSTLMMGIDNEHQLKFNSVKDAKQLLEAVKKRFSGNAATQKTQRNFLKQQYENFIAPSSEMLDQTFDRLQKLVSQLEFLDEKLSQEDVNKKLLKSLSPEWSTHAVVSRNKADLDTMSMDDLYNNLKVSNEAINAAHGVTTASTQVNTAYSTNIDNLSDAVIFSFFASQPNSPQLAHEDLQQIYPDDIEEMENGHVDYSKVECYNCHKRGHFARECRAPRNQDSKNKKSSRRSMHVEISYSTTLVSCDGLGGYDWSDHAEEGPNYALMAFSSSSSDSKGLESVEEKLEFYKKNESVYVEKNNWLKMGYSRVKKLMTILADRPKAIVNAVKGNNVNAVKASAC
ncbi:putative ribonuclease H-like domain-containing protein [Tanacetum coccineum]